MSQVNCASPLSHNPELKLPVQLEATIQIISFFAQTESQIDYSMIYCSAILLQCYLIRWKS